MGLQICCSVKCAIENERLKKIRKQQRRERKALKSRGDWMKEAQSAFNKFIRARDAGQPCISCQREHEGQWHAGHYRTVGANPELRFHEDNCHKQCSVCNNHLSGNLINYRINLVEKIGVDAVEILEGPHEPKKYTIDDLKKIKQTYKRKTKEMGDL